uniref:DNA 3'-5' helicase n=1 Tax=Candidatus Kentrum sp. TUN TaxID=2126343 RepID=A0A450ZM30_9GAMM|nr:MAG: DNA helicase-2 / ATP-dependent DNA helicase PcrA [Candidatus Kentron sp. TUN]VFK60191.1 MAG: DNA helicase-2 / ATP-dependent DNA helicase PcrA [Candidatus Kentron sp. TUN]
MPINLDTLNENQRKAVLWQDGPLLVLAGPGSGKTGVLTLRVARLVEEREDVSVLALTFTNKAAADMRERVDHLLGQWSDRVHLCTFHAFATDILQQHGSHLGLGSDFSLLVQDEERIVILDRVATALANDGYPIPADRRNLLTLLDRLFTESYDGGQNTPALVKTPTWVPLLFKGYFDELIAANQLDFGSLLLCAQRLLREKPGVARVTRLGWSHICVDEFQDTNRAQYDLLRLLAPDGQSNLFVVGDDDQILYQWNGASPERFRELRSDYDMKVIQFPETYRCPSEIVDLANKLIAYNRMRLENKQPLVSSRSASLDDNVIRYGAFDTPKDEIAAVAQDIRERRLAPGDCVVLARTTKLLESAAEILRAAGFEPYLVRRKNDFEIPLVRVVFHALRLANARHDRDVLRHLCMAWEVLSDTTLETENVAAFAALVGGDFLRAWADTVEPAADNKAVSLVKALRTTLLDRLDFPGVVDRFFSEGWKPWENGKDNELSDEIKTWQGIHGDITGEYGDGLTLNNYLQRMDLVPKTTQPDPNAIRCMTVHGAKGLEFKHVYIIGLAQEVLPSFYALKNGVNSRELEEERRNCFVAITRVQESLTLTRARQYNGWSKEPSQFLAEMGLKAE